MVKISEVSMTSPSIRPVTPTISRTRRRPSASVPRWTTRSTLDATVGTTNAAEMLSPASSGNVHIFTSASRAEFACSVHMPGQPAVERDQQVEAFLLAHLADDDARRAHAQGLLDQSAHRDLAGALQVGLARLHGHDIRQRHL